jgi:hypothetical protein
MKFVNGMSKKKTGQMWGTILSSKETVQSKMAGRLKDLAPMLKITISIQSAYAGWAEFRKQPVNLKTIGLLSRRMLSFVSLKTFKKSSRGPLS